MVAVVQLVRAPDCDSGCRGFESHQPPIHYLLLVFFFLVEIKDIFKYFSLQKTHTPIFNEPKTK